MLWIIIIGLSNYTVHIINWLILIIQINNYELLIVELLINRKLMSLNPNDSKMLKKLIMNYLNCKSLVWYLGFVCFTENYF